MKPSRQLRRLSAVLLLGGVTGLSPLNAQSVTYSGKVVDKDGTGLPWALIRAESSTVITQSGAEGSFSFTGPVSLAPRPQIFPSGSEFKAETPTGELFRADGRTFPVTPVLSTPWFQHEPLPEASKPRAPLAKTSAGYGLNVSKVNYQQGKFPQTSASASGLVLTLLKSTTDTATYAFEKKLCLDTINACRATMGLKPLAWSMSLEAFADEGARYDAEFKVAHGHFSKFNAKAIPSDAENALPGWPLKNYKTVAAVVQKGTKMMWDERLDPSGEQGHYLNIKGDHTTVGCGIFITQDGNVWVIQDFK